MFLWMAVALADEPGLSYPAGEVVEPPRLSLGISTAWGGSSPTAGVQLRYRPLDRAPVEVEASFAPGWSSVSGWHASGAAGLVVRPIVFTNSKLWFGPELSAGVGAQSWRDAPVAPYYGVGVAMGFKPAWAPVVTVGFTQSQGEAPVSGVSLRWDLGRARR